VVSKARKEGGSGALQAMTCVFGRAYASAVQLVVFSSMVRLLIGCTAHLCASLCCEWHLSAQVDVLLRQFDNGIWIFLEVMFSNFPQRRSWHH